MVNGNTILEFEQDNFGRLQELFIEENKNKFSDEELIDIDDVIERNIDKWNELVMEEFDNRFGGD